MNPISGVIKAHSIGELILDKTKINPSETKNCDNKSSIKAKQISNVYVVRGGENENQFSKLTNRWNSGSLKWKLKRMNFLCG